MVLLPRQKILPEKLVKSESYNFINVFRLTLLFCLMSTMVLGGYFTYYVLNEYEEKALQLTFNALTYHMKSYSVQSLDAKVHAVHALHSFLTTNCPLYSDWPNCTINIEDYNTFADSLISMADIANCNHEPKVYPQQIDSFVQYATDFYNKSGYSDVAEVVSQGIFAFDEDGNFHQVQEPAEGQHYLISPILQIGHPRENIGALMFNIYSGSPRITAIDRILNCVEEFDNAGLDVSVTDIIRKCVMTSRIINLVEDDRNLPAVVMMAPVLLPVEDGYKDGLSDDMRNKSLLVHLPRQTLLHVGSMSVVFHWHQMLSEASFSSTEGLDVVVSDELNEYTYTYHNGLAHLKNDGSKHADVHGRKRKKFPLMDLENNDFTVSATVYMDQEYSSDHKSLAPLYGGIITVLVIVMSVLQFLAYDYFVAQHSAEQDRAKKKYVKYISHEIRTPLTTVSLGVKFVRRELRELMMSHHASCAESPLSIENVVEETSEAKPENAVGPLMKAKLAFSGAKSKSATSDEDTKLLEMVEMLLSVEDSTTTAIRILNDLLNYDKIKSSGLTLDQDLFDVWKMVQSVTKGFVVQSKEKGVELYLTMDQEVSSRAEQHRSNSRSSGSRSKSGVGKKCAVRGSCDYSTPGQEVQPPVEAAAQVTKATSRDAKTRVVAYGDILKLEQVLRNLVSNALKFTPKNGSVEVIATWIGDGLPNCCESLTFNDVVYRPCGSLRVSVTDSGVGLSEENAKNVFNEGWQFDAKNLQAGQGSGLGLWISKNIIEAHQGYIECTSEGDGKGCSMTFEIPLLLRDETEKGIEQSVSKSFVANNLETSDRSQQYSSSRPGPRDDWNYTTVEGLGSNTSYPSPLEKVSGGVRTILIADDSPLCRKVVRRVLERAGFVCVTCSNGEECLSIVLGQISFNGAEDFELLDTNDVESNRGGAHIDLVLLDYEMPLMNGPTVVKQLRQHNCTIPVIGLTGNAGSEEVAYFRSCGADAIVSKPFSMEQLHTAIDEVWDGNSRNR